MLSVAFPMFEKRPDNGTGRLIFISRTKVYITPPTNQISSYPIERSKIGLFFKPISLYSMLYCINYTPISKYLKIKKTDIKGINDNHPRGI